MLYSIADPAAFAGLLISFLLGLALRVIAGRLAGRALRVEHRSGGLLPNARADIDPFGAVSALVATGWGKPVHVEELPRWAGRGRVLVAVLARPLTPLLVGLVGLTGYRLAYPYAPLSATATAMQFGYWTPSPLAQFLLSLSAGLISFGLLALIPLPPLDGWALLRLCVRGTGTGWAWAHEWLVEKNLGVTILLIMAFFPFGAPFLNLFIDLLSLPLLWIWA